MSAHYMECYVTQCHIIRSSNTIQIFNTTVAGGAGKADLHRLRPLRQVQVQVQDQQEEEGERLHQEAGD